jgi:hypothetical protein
MTPPPTMATREKRTEKNARALSGPGEIHIYGGEWRRQLQDSQLDAASQHLFLRI